MPVSDRMDDVTIYHNPRCSKSRAAMAALEERGITPEVRLYLDEPPDAAEVLGLIERLGDWRPLLREEGIAPQLLRRQDTTAEEAAALVARDPSVLQRPVLVAGKDAVVARDPRTLGAFLAALEGRA